MNQIIDFYWIGEVNSKDSTGQVVTTKTYDLCVGMLKSVYEKEFFQAAQAGIRPSFVIETFSMNYGGQKYIKFDDKEYSIYRTYKKGTDRIELYCQGRVGNG